ncbi:MAG TPA: DNA primase [Rhodopila sp.]|uniref:DNA primase n=1 Tax=Rhodopila sp. TaxID=2480087 RepID=UPI002BE0F21D|nr:DNA primase [Rhodopila sp.]HVY13955.1 DNA primase [Rhodopila sp.]
MALPAGFLEELRTRVPVPAVVGRRVQLARSGKQWKGCCPFHGEKTPSFYVYDDHYHCFGCGKHGDAITFVMDTQNLGFMDAVAQLAAEAGLEVPKPTPEAAEAERRRLDTIEVLQAALAHYRRRLDLPEGRAARDYLLGRGLTAETIERYGLGWAGERGGLTAELGRQGVANEQLEIAGLLRRDEETGRTFELFSNRVMFPIRDRRGAIISFGGRILGAGQPKYVNGPETPVFSKRRSLFGLDIAREAVRTGKALIVVEGYMDVIAAAQSGFTGAVAPLGTALTQEQLEQLWRISAAPVLCFDGDSAGARAAARAMDLALPMLTSGHTLKFATLPAGEDPDSLVRKGGAGALQAILDIAQAPVEALYGMLRQEVGDASAEQRAALRNRLTEVASRIADKALASEYRSALLDRFFASRPRNGGTKSGARANGVRPMNSVVRTAPRQVPQPNGAIAERMRILTAILLRHPALFHDVAHAFDTLGLDDRLAGLRNAIESYANTAETLDSAGLMDHLTQSGFERDVQLVLAGAPMPLPACVASDAMPAEAEREWWHIFGFLNVDRLREEVELAKVEAGRNLTQETQQRLQALREALLNVQSGDPDGASMNDA